MLILPFSSWLLKAERINYLSCNIILLFCRHRAKLDIVQNIAFLERVRNVFYLLSLTGNLLNCSIAFHSVNTHLFFVQDFKTSLAKILISFCIHF